MLMDRIKTWKNGSWQRAVVKKWNGSAWEVCEVWSTGEGIPVGNNLNATEKVRTYYPTWRARYDIVGYEWDNYIGKVSTNNATIFECGQNYNNLGLNYSIYVGMPQSTIASDSLNTFGIDNIVITYTLNSYGSYGYGQPEIYAHTSVSSPTLGGQPPSTVMNGSSAKYFGMGWFSQNGIESMLEFNKIFYAMASGEVKGIILTPEWESEQKWFSISNLKFVVTWVGK